MLAGCRAKSFPSELCVCTERLQMAWVVQKQRSRNGSELAGGTVISKPSARSWAPQPLWVGCLPFGQGKDLDPPCSVLPWTGVFGISSGREVDITSLGSSGLLEPHLRELEVESLLISSLTSTWYCLAVFSAWLLVGFFKITLGSLIHTCQGDVMRFMVSVLSGVSAKPIINVSAASTFLPSTGRLVKGRSYAWSVMENRENGPFSFKNWSPTPGVLDMSRITLWWGLGLDICCVFRVWWVSKNCVWGRILQESLQFSFWVSKDVIARVSRKYTGGCENTWALFLKKLFALCLSAFAHITHFLGVWQEPSKEPGLYSELLHSHPAKSLCRYTGLAPPRWYTAARQSAPGT